jgi:hypothetical protein
MTDSVSPLVFPVLSSALDEFRKMLKIARDDLAEVPCDTVGDISSFDCENGEDEGAVVVDKSTFKSLLRDLADYNDTINHALVDFDWSVERALRALRQR